MRSCDVVWPWVLEPTVNCAAVGWVGRRGSPCGCCCCWFPWICFNSVINEAATCGWLWSAERTVNNTCMICWFCEVFVKNCPTNCPTDGFISEPCSSCCCWNALEVAAPTWGVANPRPFCPVDPWKASALGMLPPNIRAFTCGTAEKDCRRAWDRSLAPREYAPDWDGTLSCPRADWFGCILTSRGASRGAEVTLVVAVTELRSLVPGNACTNSWFATVWPAVLGCQDCGVAAIVACCCCCWCRCWSRCVPVENGCCHICWEFVSTRLTFGLARFEGLAAFRFNIDALLCTSSMWACCWRSNWASTVINSSADEHCCTCNSPGWFCGKESILSTTIPSLSICACCCSIGAVSMKSSADLAVRASPSFCSSALLSISTLKWRWFRRSAVWICTSSLRLMDSKASSCSSCLSDKSLFLSK